MICHSPKRYVAQNAVNTSTVKWSQMYKVIDDEKQRIPLCAKRIGTALFESAIKSRRRARNYWLELVRLACLCPRVDSSPEVATSRVTGAGVLCRLMSGSGRAVVEMPTKKRSRGKGPRPSGVPAPGHRSSRRLSTSQRVTHIGAAVRRFRLSYGTTAKIAAGNDAAIFLCRPVDTGGPLLRTG